MIFVYRPHEVLTCNLDTELSPVRYIIIVQEELCRWSESVWLLLRKYGKILLLENKGDRDK